MRYSRFSTYLFVTITTLILPAVVGAISAVAGVSIQDPSENDAQAVNGIYSYQASADVPGTYKWKCVPTTDGSFPQGNIGASVNFVPLKKGTIQIVCDFTPNDPAIAPSSDSKGTRNYEINPISDDNYAQRSPPEPELKDLRAITGTGNKKKDFIAPLEQHINLRYEVDGPPGQVLMLYQTAPVTPENGMPPTGQVNKPNQQLINAPGEFTVGEKISEENDTRVKGTTLSSGKGDIEIDWRIGGDNSNEGIGIYAYLTVAEIKHVLPKQDDVASDLGEPCARVMISTKHDSSYHNTSEWTFQEQDAECNVSPELNPPISGVAIWYKTADPDDPSVYETDDDADDNDHSGMKKGNLRNPQGTTVVPNSEVKDGDNVVEFALRMTDDEGKLPALLEITDRYGGDNYRVRCGFDREYKMSKESCLLVAWKRFYTEVDRMYEFGYLLSAHFTADSDNNPDHVQLTETQGFNVGDEVLIFDADHPTGEAAEITAIDTNTDTVTLDRDLSNSYSAGLDRSLGHRCAALVRPDDGFREVDTALVSTAVDVGFLEIMELSSGSGNVPWYDLPTEAIQKQFSTMWFANDGQENYIHVIGAYMERGSGSYGVAHTIEDVAISFIYTIEYNATDDAQAIKELTAHEIVHNCDCSNSGKASAIGDCSHTDNILGDSKPCLMNNSDIDYFEDGSVEMMEDEIEKIRKNEDET